MYRQEWMSTVESLLQQRKLYVLTILCKLSKKAVSVSIYKQCILGYIALSP